MVMSKVGSKLLKAQDKGNPLPHFLFVIVADALSILILRAKENRLLEGFTIGRSKTTISHLQFADDAFFFLEFVQKNYKLLR